MKLREFYATGNWSSGWGVVDDDHPTPHKGLDIVHDEGTAIPALRAGTVVESSPSSSVGHYMVVQVDDSNEFDTYCHVVAGRAEGQHVAQGEEFALVAGYDDPHGISWTGPHTHLCRATTEDGWAYWGGSNINPEPVVRAVLGSTTVADSGTATLHRKARKMDEIVCHGDKVPDVWFTIHLSDNTRSWLPYGAVLLALGAAGVPLPMIDQVELDKVPYRKGDIMQDGQIAK